jgi:hypothetical protein
VATGAAQQDASLQLVSLFSAASQRDFLTAACKGSLSPCGVLLLKLTGSCHAADVATAASATNSSSTARYLTVGQLSNWECAQLLEKMTVLLDGSLKQQEGEEDRTAAGRRVGSRGSLHGGHGPGSSSSGSASDDDSSDDSSSDSDESDAGHDSPLVGASPDVQQMQQALAALAAAAAASTVQQSQHEQQQQQHNIGCERQGLLASFSQQFQQLMASMPDLLLPSTAVGAATAAAAVHTPSGATLAATPALQRVKPKAAAAADSTLTPGGLASRLKRQVRFAPGTPDHHGLAGGALDGALATGSNHSTPDDPAVAGLINTPNKRSSSNSKPKKKLFDPAAVAAAAAAAEGGRSSRKSSKKGEKQKAEVGEIAGSSAAVLAAVAAVTGAGAVAAAEPDQRPGKPAPAASSSSSLVVGNKRMQRLMQMMLSSAGPGSRKGSASPGTPAAAAAAAGLSEPVNGKSLAAGRQAELATPPAQQKAAGALHTLHTPQTPLSPRCSRQAAGRPTASRPLEKIPAAAAGAAAASEADAVTAAGPVTKGLVSPSRGHRTGSSRLAKQSAPAAPDQTSPGITPTQTSPGAPVAMQTDVGATAAGQQQQQQDVSCATMLARLLHAVIPKLLLDWCCPSAAVSISSSRCSPLLAAAGAAAFTFDDLQLLSSLLSPAPRAAVHAALTAPNHLLPGHPEQEGPGWEDTCLAYLLLQQQRDDGLPVSDWFGLFCQAQGVQGLGESPGQDVGRTFPEEDVPGGGSRAVVARARAGRKARGYAEARGGTGDDVGGDAAPDVLLACAGSNGGRRRPAPSDQNAAAATGSGKKCNDPGVASDDNSKQAAAKAAVDERQLLEAAARFSQAAAELQLLGVWKATKRRRLSAVQRVFAPECYTNVSSSRPHSLGTAVGCDENDESLPDEDLGSE